jgi:lysophospholipase L1-like esterase
VTAPRLTHVAVATLVAVATGALAASPAAAAPTPSLADAKYVALGDSYSAGPFIPLPKGTPIGCQRSDHNFPTVVAKELGITSFTDVSCSAAKTDHFTAPQSVSLGANPPQFDALTTDTDLVTFSMGGNDVGFGEIIQECATRSPLQPFGSACKDFYTSGGTDKLAARIAATAPKITAGIKGIKKRSPKARVLVVGYPAILPDEGPGCFPVVPFSAGDVAYLRDTEKRLNAMLKKQAEGAGADYVNTYTPSIGHDICQLPGKKWIEGLVPTAPAAPVHPNAQGMGGMAQAVIGELSDVTVREPGA